MSAIPAPTFRVVADTNVILQIRWQGTEDRYETSGYQESPAWEFLRRFGEGHFRLLMTVSMLLELAEQLLLHGVDDQTVQTLTDQIRLYAEEVEVPVIVTPYCRDPDDDKFIEAAIHGRATHLVSADRAVIDFVTLNRTSLGFRIVQLVGFLRELRQALKVRSP